MERCLDDAELLAALNEVELDPALARHLAECPPCQERRDEMRRLLDGVKLLRGPRLTTTALRESAAAPLLEAVPQMPETIGRYRIFEWLGHGGQAEVYRSEHPTLGIPVAVKWSHRPLTEDAGPLVAEGKLLAALDIDGVAKVYDLDVHENRPFLVMGILKGRTLHRYVSENDLTHRQIAALMAGVARILASAHARGIVHFDLKPANIVIEDGRPIVIDFGMAKFANAWNENEPPSGGTIGFMSPEQAAAVLQPSRSAVAEGRAVVGPPSDVFSLGAVLYWLLTRQAPYVGDDDILALLTRARRGDYDRARLKAPGVPPRLARICLKAMAREPAERYGSAAAMASELDRFAAPSKKRRYAFSTAAVAALIVVPALLLKKQPVVGPLPSTAGVNLPDPVIAQQQLLVASIERAGRVLTPKSAEDLSACLPLQPTDRIKLTCKVPRGAAAGVFMVGPRGDVAELIPHVGKGGRQYDQLVFPEKGGWAPEPGTVALLIVVGRNDKPQIKDVQTLFAQAAGARNTSRSQWPPLDADVLVVVTHDDVEAFGDKPMGVESSYSRIHDRLNELRERLGEQFDYFWGIALPVDADSLPEK